MSKADTPLMVGAEKRNFLVYSIFFGLHLACLLGIWTGVSVAALSVCLILYLVRMFAITAGYHRYFSHHSYRTGRLFQFLLALLGTTAGQKGPIWWAGHHRHHHRFSDKPEDVHSPHAVGIWWAHVGWILSTRFLRSRSDLVKDLLKYPELRLLDRYHYLPPLLLALLLYVGGELLGPSLHTSGIQLFIWGFCISTVLVYHGTFLVNSAAHLIGRKRFITGDESRNSFAISIFTLGEGWHNNHHRYPGSCRQGFYWWELDVSYYILKLFSWFGIVWDLRSPPQRIYQEAEESRGGTTASAPVKEALVGENSGNAA